MDKRAENSELRRNDFLKAFLILCHNNSVDKISVSSLCSLAGYSRRTFYKYFLDINDLVDYAENELVQTMVERYKATIGSTNTREITKMIADSCDDFGHFLTALLGADGNPLFLTKYTTVLCPVLAEQFHKSADSPKIHALSEFMLFSYIIPIVVWHAKGKPFPLEELCDMFENLTTKDLIGAMEKILSSPSS